MMQRAEITRIVSGCVIDEENRIHTVKKRAAVRSSDTFGRRCATARRPRFLFPLNTTRDGEGGSTPEIGLL